MEKADNRSTLTMPQLAGFLKGALQLQVVRESTRFRTTATAVSAPALGPFVGQLAWDFEEEGP
jgi:hypothetical protein